MDQELELLGQVQQQIRRLEARILERVQITPTIQLIQSVPGPAKILSIVIDREVGSIDRFPSPHHFASYSGLVPSTKSNGGVTRHGRITREGSWGLRWALVEAALVHLRYDTPVTRAYHRIAESRDRKTARVAAARMLLEVCYSVLRYRRPYYNPLYAQA